MRHLVLLLATVCLLSCRSSLPPATVRNLHQIVDEAVALPFEEKRFSGVILVRHQGRDLVRRAWGLADAEHGQENTPDTRFMIMSVSKQFTAALIARLAARGALSLDDRVAKYLDDWPSEWGEVRVRHLLDHSSGLDIDTTYFWIVKQHPEYWIDKTETPPPYVPIALKSEPGRAFLYANVGYTLLSLIAAEATGESFDTLVSEEVLQPLGLQDTMPERGQRVAGRARGYALRDGELVLSEQGTIDIVGAGDMVSTADDLATFARRFHSDRFLPQSLRQEMLSTRVAGMNARIGYGWFVRESAGHRLEYHLGSGAGFRAANYNVPSLDLQIVVLSNVASNSSWVTPMVDKLVSAFEAAPSSRPRVRIGAL